MAQPISVLIALEASRWASVKITRDYSSIAKQIIRGKDVYLQAQAATGVPWFMIGCWHIREASGNFMTQLAQGDPLNRASTHVPKGRGPFPNWIAGAKDALINCPPKAASWHNWSAGGSMAVSNLYNGTGYWLHNIPSPYVWSGTNWQRPGKYTSDGHLDLNFVDTQPGVANLVLHLMALDSNVKFFDTQPAIGAPQNQHGDIVVPVHPDAAPPIVPDRGLFQQPSISNPAPGSVGAKIVDWFHALEKRV